MPTAQFKPTPTDGFETETTKVQLETEILISELFKAIKEPDSPSSYVLQKNVHLTWAAKLLIHGFPARYVSQDASQPWLLFWLLQTFQTLGVALDPDTKKTAIKTIMANQHPDGGFGGGPMQMHHIIPTYASVCSLAIVGFPGEGGGWDQIDRKRMYDWFMKLKQPDGSFVVSEDMELDMRGNYCLLTVATLLDLLTPELVRGTADYISSCQTYEGGFAASCQPYYGASPPSPYNLLSSPRPPLGEAHGGYTFCAVASLLLLRYLPDPSLSRVNIDVQSLLRWTVSMQGAEVDGGGFRGRTNKLVDGCYSWWVGGLFNLISELLGGDDVDESGGAHSSEQQNKAEYSDRDKDWDDDDNLLFDAQALQKFILISSQSAQGGLRDKPGKPADAYHTLYNLSGLSAAQHKVNRSHKETEKLRLAWVNSASPVVLEVEGTEAEEERNARRKEVYAQACSWVEDEGASKYVGGPGNRVNATHPIFDLTITATKSIMNYFYGQKV